MKKKSASKKKKSASKKTLKNATLSIEREKIRNAVLRKTKTANIILRITEEEKDEMKLAANLCDLSLTDYVIGLHRCTWQRLEKRLKK